MKSPRIVLILVAIASGLAALWLTRPAPAPLPPPPPSPALPAPASTRFAPPPAELPAPVTVLGILAAEHGVHARWVADAPRVLELALYKAGGEPALRPRSEERRVGKECRSRWSPYH